MQSNLPATATKPLCALFANFERHSERMFQALDELRWSGQRRTSIDQLAALHEKLWIVQDTGDMATFRRMQKEILAHWTKIRESVEADYKKTMGMPDSW